jgi:hypothetical protein
MVFLKEFFVDSKNTSLTPVLAPITIWLVSKSSGAAVSVVYKKTAFPTPGTDYQ